MNKKEFLLRGIAILSSLMVLVFCSWNPIDFLQEAQTKYEQYQQQYPSVKINMVFNQPVFSPGDTSFFNAWYTNEENIPVKGNHIVNVDLISGSGSTMQQIRFRVKDGSSNNQIVFNKELKPGVYKLVAYTDWMKNFGETWFYQKRIQILQRNKVAIQESIDHGIKFYSEGGHFVNGLMNKMVVVGPPSEELIIKNQQSTIIQKLTLDPTGLGSLMITPESGQSYFAEVNGSGKSLPLPKVDQDGVVMQLDHKGEQISFAIPKDSKLDNQEIYVISTASGKIVSKEKIVLSLDQSNNSMRLTPKQGVLNQIFVFNSMGKLIGQRVFSPLVLDNPITVKMQFPTQAMQRGNVMGGISIVDKSGTPMEAEVSITVLQDNLFNDFDVSNSYLSELPELTERIESFGKLSETLNDFLITQTWKKINWEAILSSNPTTFKFPFQAQSTLKGQVISDKTGFPPPDSTILLTYLQKNTVGYEAYVNKGKFEMPLIFDFWGEDYIFCSLQNKSRTLDGDYTISILKDSIKLTQRWNSVEDTEPSPYGDYAFKKKLVTNSFNYFSVDQSGTASENLNPNALLEEEFMGVDYTVNVGDYLIFPKMEDLLREVVPFVQHRRKGDVESVRMFFRYLNTTKVSKGDPLYVIDGLMCMNTPYFLGLKPEDVLFIKLINNPNKLSQLGKLGENGVIFVESRKGNLAPISIVKNLFPIVGLNRAVDFSKNQSVPGISVTPHIPNLHSTLYWKPSMIVSSSAPASVSFSTGDDIGPMRIVVRGVTKGGYLFSAEQVIHVGFNAVKN